MSTATKVLIAILGVAGAAHFAIPNGFDKIVPHALPGSTRMSTYVSGAAELAVAGIIAVPRTRRMGGLLAAALFVAVFPANIQMAVDWSDRSWPQRLVVPDPAPERRRSLDATATTNLRSVSPLGRLLRSTPSRCCWRR